MEIHELAIKLADALENDQVQVQYAYVNINDLVNTTLDGKFNLIELAKIIKTAFETE